MVTAGNGAIEEEPSTINAKKAANGSGTPKTPKKEKKKEKSPEPEPEEENEEEEAVDGKHYRQFLLLSGITLFVLPMRSASFAKVPEHHRC